MTTIYDIPYEDIKIFLEANNIIFKNENDAYEKTRILLKDRKAIGHTNNIIEWMIAYNLLKRKVNIPNYTIYEIDKLYQNEIDQLAKLLTMDGNDVENIKNILRYLHKLDEGVNISNNQNLTLAGEAIYNIILSNMSNKTINRMDINKYSKLYLEDQQFWKKRLNDIFGLRTEDKNFDYKLAVKFLDNGKSLDENYHEAMDKGLKPIIKLLLGNEVVDVIEPDNFLDKINTTLPELGEIKNLLYEDFIEKIIKVTNEITEGEVIDSNYFDKIEFTGKKFNIAIDIEDVTGENANRQTKATFINDSALTNGEILYKIAQLIPNDKEIREINLKNITLHTNNILEQIEYHREAYIQDHKIKKLKDYNKEVPKKFLEELIKSPEAFLDFLNKNSKNMMNEYLRPELRTNEPYYDFLPDYSDYFGNHIYWEGLRKWKGEDEYHIVLGS